MHSDAETLMHTGVGGGAWEGSEILEEAGLVLPVEWQSHPVGQFEERLVGEEIINC